MRGRYWTTPEIEYLREHYPNNRTADIAAHLCRSVASVNQKAREIGVSKSGEFLREACMVQLPHTPIVAKKEK